MHLRLETITSPAGKPKDPPRPAPQAPSVTSTEPEDENEGIAGALAGYLADLPRAQKVRPKQVFLEPATSAPAAAHQAALRYQ